MRRTIGTRGAALRVPIFSSGVDRSVGNLEGGQEAIRDELKIVAEGTRMNSEAIERSRQAIERHCTM